MLGWTQHQIADKLQALYPEAKGTSQPVINNLLSEIGNFRKQIKSDIEAGHKIETVAQRACLALEILPLLEKEAKQRQLATLKQNATVVENFPQREEGKARDQAAAIVSTNGRYVSDAKILSKEAPSLKNTSRTNEGICKTFAIVPTPT